MAARGTKRILFKWWFFQPALLNCQKVMDGWKAIVMSSPCDLDSTTVLMPLRQSLATCVGLFGRLIHNGSEKRYNSVQQRHQRMRKKWPVADCDAIDATQAAFRP